MKRAAGFLLLLVVPLVSAAGWAASPTDQQEATAPSVVSGLYSLSFNVNLGSTVPAGATVTCKAKIAPGAGIFQKFGSSAVPVTAFGVATVTGNQANCMVDIPFSWTVNDPRNGVALTYEIRALHGSGSLQPLVQSSAQQTISAPFPPAGGTASISFRVMF